MSESRWVTLRLSQDELDAVASVLGQKCAEIGRMAPEVVKTMPKVAALAETLGDVVERLDTAWGMAQETEERPRPAPVEWAEESPGVWKTATPEDAARLDDEINDALGALGTSLEELRKQEGER